MDADTEVIHFRSDQSLEVCDTEKNTHNNAMRSSPSRSIQVLHLRIAKTGVDPFGFPDALVIGRHVVEAGVEVEHEEKIPDGPNHSNRQVKT